MRYILVEIREAVQKSTENNPVLMKRHSNEKHVISKRRNSHT